MWTFFSFFRGLILMWVGDYSCSNSELRKELKLLIYELRYPADMPALLASITNWLMVNCVTSSSRANRR
jgi:hypothetical protein